MLHLHPVHIHPDDKAKAPMFRSRIDQLLESSVVPSFTSIGPHLRRRLFDWRSLESYDLSDRVIVLTGGTSGIGEAAAEIYAERGATLVVVARDADKCRTLIARLGERTGNDRLHAVIADLGKLDDVRRAAGEISARHPHIDVLAHNAGALFPDRKRASDGTDLAVELMVAAPFLLTGLLLPALAGASSGTGRVLTMSSGGMYTEPLTVDELEMSDDDYSGTAQYARAKRAQVVLSELWAERIAVASTVFHALHPGWVDTPGINDALPGFSRVLSPLRLLRSATAGADTLVWLSADDAALGSSGDFWHDRAQRSTHKMSKTRTSDTETTRAALWSWCEQHTGWTFG